MPIINFVKRSYKNGKNFPWNLQKDYDDAGMNDPC